MRWPTNCLCPPIPLPSWISSARSDCLLQSILCKQGLWVQFLLLCSSFASTKTRAWQTWFMEFVSLLYNFSSYICHQLAEQRKHAASATVLHGFFFSKLLVSNFNACRLNSSVDNCFLFADPSVFGCSFTCFLYLALFLQHSTIPTVTVKKKITEEI